MLIYLVKLNERPLYVGQVWCAHGTVEGRWKGHVRYARHGDSRPLYRCMRQYGADAFSVAAIDTAASYEELDQKEKYYIQLYRTHISQGGCNLTLGGSGRYVRGCHKPKKKRAVRPKVRKPLSYRCRLDEALRAIPRDTHHSKRKQYVWEKLGLKYSPA